MPDPVDPWSATPEEMAEALDRYETVWEWLDTIEGNCFIAASVVMLAAQHVIPQILNSTGATLPNHDGDMTHYVHCVHGIARNADDGEPMWHAWVELLTNMGPLVLEFSNRHRKVLDRDLYYRIGEIKETWRYPLSTWEEEADKRPDDLGPWVPEDVLKKARFRDRSFG